MTNQLYISVIGASEATARQYALAEAAGRKIAEAKAILVCGGLSGFMEAAAKGAYEAGGLTVGILPFADRTGANPYLTVALPTGLGHARNYLVAASGDGVLAVGGAAGTLSEIGLALKMGRPVVLLESLDMKAAGLKDELLYIAGDPGKAVGMLIKLLS